MKIIPFSVIYLSALAATLHSQQQVETGAFRDVATHASLAQELRMVNASDPMKALEKSEGSDPSKENQPQNFIDSSDLISFQGLTTLVPKRAIIQIPEAFQSRVNNHMEGNRLVGWLEFYALNRGWITTVEITRAQAGGNEDLAESLTEHISKSKNMVVTVMDSGPISYMPYRGETQEKETK